MNRERANEQIEYYIDYHNLETLQFELKKAEPRSVQISLRTNHLDNLLST